MNATTVHPDQSLLEFQAACLRQYSGNVAHWVETTDPAKLDWRPGEPSVSKARTILDQISELVRIHRRQAAQLRGEDPSMVEAEVFADGPTAIQALRESAEAHAAALEAAGPSALAELVETPFGQVPRGRLNAILLMNLAYHGGVVNAYQLMYGDEEFHIPPMPSSG